ncbi:MAG: hypothetical protein JNL83_30015 [Myxococcales bacterium]|nr:hypothetical protein [Myxococcales bacterium]
MTRRLLCLVLPLALVLAPGCTLIGAAAGGGLASHANHQEELRRARAGQPAGDSSILPGVATGAGVGLIVDAVLISMLISSTGSTEPNHDDPFCCFGWEND